MTKDASSDPGGACTIKIGGKSGFLGLSVNFFGKVTPDESYGKVTVRPRKLPSVFVCYINIFLL